MQLSARKLKNTKTPNEGVSGKGRKSGAVREVAKEVVHQRRKEAVVKGEAADVKVAAVIGAVGRKESRLFRGRGGEEA